MIDAQFCVHHLSSNTNGDPSTVTDMMGDKIKVNVVFPGGDLKRGKVVPDERISDLLRRLNVGSDQILVWKDQVSPR